jgi:magnesium-transporting ATPase (P-type)
VRCDAIAREQGASLRNTHYVVGIVVYAGTDTKLVRNQRKPPSKFSQLDLRLNNAVIAIFVMDLVLVLLLTVLSGVFEVRWRRR